MQPITILVVDDNPGDIELFGFILEEGRCQAHIIPAQSPQIAMGILSDKEEYPNVDLIVLDLMMGGGSTMKFYHDVKNNSEMAKIPIMLHSGVTFENAKVILPFIKEEMFLEKACGVNDWGKVVDKIKDVVSKQLKMIFWKINTSGRLKAIKSS
jgi:CheY-like chemotaxis protein